MIDKAQVHASAAVWAKSNGLELSQLSNAQRFKAAKAVAEQIGEPHALVAEAMVELWAHTNDQRGASGLQVTGAQVHRPASVAQSGGAASNNAVRLRIDLLIDAKAAPLTAGIVSNKQRGESVSAMDLEVIYHKAPINQAELLSSVRFARDLIEQHSKADGSLDFRHVRAALDGASGARQSTLMALARFAADADGKASDTTPPLLVKDMKHALASAQHELEKMLDGKAELPFSVAYQALALHDTRTETHTNAVGATHTRHLGAGANADRHDKARLLEHAVIAAPLAAFMDVAEHHTRQIYSEVEARSTYLNTVFATCHQRAQSSDGRDALVLHFARAGVRGELPQLGDALRSVDQRLAHADNNIFTRLLRSKGSLSNDEIRAFLNTDSLAAHSAQAKLDLGIHPDDRSTIMAPAIERWRLGSDLIEGGVKYPGIGDGV